MAYWRFLISVLLLVIKAEFILGFRAAVFEHAEQSSATSSGTPANIIQSNLEYYKRATEFAKSKEVDVIVFPEYGIFPTSTRSRIKSFLEYVPDPNVTETNPCKEPGTYSNRTILYTLSCLAHKNRMIIVANMGDIQPCKGEKKCPKDGTFHFNTNVVFNRDGKIIARYHKEHLFEELGMDVPIGVQDPTFETDLGRFATFVCFDIVFKRIVDVARWKGVKAILFPTMWLNSSPLINSPHSFEAWAFGNNVTLLAANVHLPGKSGLGSGIMKGRKGALVYTFNPDGHSKLLIAELTDKPNATPNSSIFIVTKNETKEWTDDGIDVADACSRKVLNPVRNIYKDYRCLDRDTTNFKLIKLVKSSDHIEACNNGMCCALTYSTSKKHWTDVICDSTVILCPLVRLFRPENRLKEDFYLGVYNGTYNAINRYLITEENCFVGRCDGFQNRACVTFPMRSKTLFYDVFLKANFSTDYIYPTVVKSGMRLTPTDQWTFSKNGRDASLHIQDSSGKDLLMVGFKARAYDRDPPYVRN